MAKFWRQIGKDERGQALPLVLVLLVLGSLLVIPSLSYASTSMRAGQIIEKQARGMYAADAGVERVLWSIMNSITPPGQLTEEVNQMEVVIQTEDRGAHTLTQQGVVVGVTGNHYDWLAVTSEAVWEEGAGAYKYTITVTWQADPGTPAIKLTEVGARLPAGYTYQTGSAADFPGNLSADEPDETVDYTSACMLSWELPAPRPEVSAENPVATQVFYIAGEADLHGDYSWVVASRSDIGTVGEIIGQLYRIEAQAMIDGGSEIAATIKADVLWNEQAGEMYILAWQISP